MTDIDIKKILLPHMINAAIKAGSAIMEVYNSNQEVEVEMKGDHTPITYADRAAHNAIKEALAPTRIPIFSEEGREMIYEERRNWELFWLVDPLDGTVEFINKTNEFTVNIALVDNGVPMAGVIYVPYLKKIYFAWNNSGAFLATQVEPDAESNLNYEQITTDSTRLPLVDKQRETQIVALSRSHTTDETREMVSQIAQQTPLEVVEQGSSYKFCMLAEGAADYYVRTSSTSEWDTAAGEVILAESGGMTAQLNGDSALQYNKENPTNPWFHCRSAISRI